MYTRAELKELAKQQLRGRWGDAVIVTLIFILISSIPFAMLVLGGPLMLGYTIYFLQFTAMTQPVNIDTLFRGFYNFEKALGLFWWTFLWVWLWSWLFVIPGIVKYLAYSQSFYILAENPNISVFDALKVSIRMTRGHKGELFVMNLSFIGWIFLTMFTFGIGSLWLMPYMMASFTNLYRKLKESALQTGVCTPEEFGMQA